MLLPSSNVAQQRTLLVAVAVSANALLIIYLVMATVTSAVSAAVVAAVCMLFILFECVVNV